MIHAGEKGNFVGAIKIAAETLASMGYGLPMKNVESYLKGLFHWTMPGVEVAYEDLLAAPDKAGLKGLTGDALRVRLEHVMQGYGVELEEPVVAALAALYEAGYPDAVAGGAPDTVKVGGIEVELSRRMKKLYNQARADVLNQELAAVLGSAFFAEADQETQTRMVKRLYDYAGEKAKKQIFPDCEVSDSLTEYAEVAEAGGSIAECIIFKTVTGEINGEPAMKNYMKADLLREWDADDSVKELMFRHLISDNYDEEIVKLRDAGVSFDQFLEVYAKHGEIDAKELDATTKATEFAYWLDAQRFSSAQKSSIKYEMVFMDFTPAQADRYNTATEAGLNREDALELTEKLNGLEPPEGKTSIQQIQKWRVAIDDAWDEQSQLQWLKAAGMNDAAYAKCEALWGEGVAPAAYVRAKELESQFDSDGNGSLTNEDWRNLINSMTTSGIVLPGNTEQFHLTNEQLGFLWQMLTGSKSTKNNPFSRSGGEKWLTIKEQMKEDEEE